MRRLSMKFRAPYTFFFFFFYPGLASVGFRVQGFAPIYPPIYPLGFRGWSFWLRVQG